MKLEEIREHWEKAGRAFPANQVVTPTSRDPYLALLEEDNIVRHLRSDNIVLEMGCGDGVHSVKYARKVRELRGVDIAPSLVELAKKRAAIEKVQNAQFIVGSVLELTKTLPTDHFDTVISQRCLINLPEWTLQQDAIVQAHSLLSKDGTMILTEGFQEELDNLNKLRKQLGLSEIKVVSYNRNMVRKDFEIWANQYFDVLKVQHYGLYFLLSRVLHPLAVLPEDPKHDSKINECAMKIARILEISDLEKYSYNLCYVLQKK